METLRGNLLIEEGVGMRNWLTAMAAFFLVLAAAAAGEASPQRITATGVYVMGENDSPRIAKDAARQEAMRIAVEKAGVYVESYSRSENMTLTEDDVRVLSGAVLKVTSEKDVPELLGNVWRYTVTLTAEIDPDKMDLKAMMQKREELEKLQKERDDLRKQNEELLEKYKEAAGSEKDRLGTKLEKQYTLGQIFDRCVSLIQRGEHQTAVRELTAVIGDRSVTDSPLAYAYYLRGRAYYEQHAERRALEDFNETQRIPHDDGVYPVWRAHYYRGRIYYDRGRWQDACEELRLAWDASGHNDPEIGAALRRAEAKAHPAEAAPSGHGVDWGKIIGEIIDGTINSRRSRHLMPEQPAFRLTEREGCRNRMR